jgi:hypothetical protein
MNASVKSGFLNEIFLPEENLLIDYDFRSPIQNTNYYQLSLTAGATGYLEFNLQKETGLQYSGGQIIDTGYPALGFTDSGATPFSLVSGNFNGSAKYKILGNLDLEDWTVYIAFKHLETGLFSDNKVLFSNKNSISQTSGFVFGINGCNRLFCEYNISANEKRIFTLNRELDNKNVASLTKIDNDLFIGLHQYEDLNYYSTEDKFTLSDYSKSNTYYLGGLGVSGSSYRNFSGYIDQFILMDRGLEFPERNTFSEGFYCSGYQTGSYQKLVNTFNAVTGIEYQTVLDGTGITGYQKYLKGYDVVNGANVPIYSYSGVTGLIYSEKLVELTGSVTGDYELWTFYTNSGLPDYNYILNFSNSKILSFNNFDSSYKEVYSFSGKNSNDVNLTSAFISSNNKFSILPTGSGETVNFYLNGLVEPLLTSLSSSYTGDFVVSGAYLESDGFFDKDDIAVYDLIYGSGSITGITTAQENSGFAVFSTSFINNRDLYLNGIKLISGVDYYYNVTSGIVVRPSGMVAGDLLVLPKHNSNLSRYTGYNDNNFDTNIKLFDEQVWINGLRQVKYVDYEKVSDFSLKYSSFSLEPYVDEIYNNNTGFFNV